MAKTTKTVLTQEDPREHPRRLQGTVVSGRFSDIKVPAALRAVLKTGWDYIDALFTGSGIRPSTCCMVSGLPGGGKTTICLQLANALAAEGHVVVFNSIEECDSQVKMRLEDMGMNDLLNPRADAFFSNFYDIAEVLAYADKIRSTHKPKPGKGFFLFVDSLQCLERHTGKRGRPASELQQQCDAMWDIAAWCKENMTVAVVISQVTKNGEFAGKQEVKHAIDVHLELVMDTDRKSETHGQRICSASKNRYGPSGLFFTYEINGQGIVFSS